MCSYTSLYAHTQAFLISPLYEAAAGGAKQDAATSTADLVVVLAVVVRDERSICACMQA